MERLLRQNKLFENLNAIQKSLQENTRESREGKIEILRKIIKDIKSEALPEWKGIIYFFN